MKRSIVRLIAIALIFCAGVAVATLSQLMSGRAAKTVASGSKPEAKSPPDSTGVIAMDDERMRAAEIELADARSGTVARRLIVPAVIVPDADKVARVTAKVAGTVSELRRNIGDQVARGDILGAIESREVAEARSDYLAARLSDDLQQELTSRDKGLFEGRAVPEQQYLKSRSAAAQSRMRFDVARQKLLALGIEESEIAAIPAAPESSLRLQYVRAPISGRIVERKVELGMAVGRDGLSTEMFAMVDLGKVWVEMTVNAGDVPQVKEGQSATISVAGSSTAGTAKVVFVNPVLDKDTRAARVVAVLDNPEGLWRPGAFVTAAIGVDVRAAPVVIPGSAVQTARGRKVVFVRTPEGFRSRDIILGQRDGVSIEVVSGLTAGERVASSNTFALKAELSKPSDED